MKKIVNLFENKNLKTFIRIIISEDCIKLHHITNGKIYHHFHVQTNNSVSIFKYLETYAKISIEIIVKSKIMSCKNILYKDITSSGIKSLAKHVLHNKKNIINTVFCSDQKQNQRDLCEAFINQHQNDFLKKLLFANKNTIRCTTVWPMWIVSSYFNEFREDQNKFACSVFVIEQQNYLEIICCNASGIISYRQESGDSAQQKKEIENTIKYLSQIHKISPQDIAIYIINDEIINNFSTYSEKNMSIFSSTIDTTAMQQKHNILKIANLCMLTMFLASTSNIFFNYLDIATLQKQIAIEKNSLQSIDSNITKEAIFWKNIQANDMIKCNFQQEIENLNEPSLQKISIKVDYANGRLSIDSVPNPTCC